MWVAREYRKERLQEVTKILQGCIMQAADDHLSMGTWAQKLQHGLKVFCILLQYNSVEAQWPGIPHLSEIPGSVNTVFASQCGMFHHSP